MPTIWVCGCARNWHFVWEGEVREEYFQGEKGSIKKMYFFVLLRYTYWALFTLH